MARRERGHSSRLATKHVGKQAARPCGQESTHEQAQFPDDKALTEIAADAQFHWRTAAAAGRGIAAYSEYQQLDMDNDGRKTGEIDLDLFTEYVGTVEEFEDRYDEFQDDQISRENFEQLTLEYVDKMERLTEAALRGAES